jgi:hypothetical protein
VSQNNFPEHLKTVTGNQKENYLLSHFEVGQPAEIDPLLKI